jgi:diguanylate cyclase (GGDEF)-like protein
MKRQRGLNYGLLTAVGAVVGLVLLRATFSSAESLSADFLSNRFTYIYVFVATAVTFLVLGYVLGRQADALRRLSATDALTGLCNRRALQDRLRDECRRSARYKFPLALLLIDIDDLKGVNDAKGHSAGDDLLRRTATAIQRSLRTMDCGARWGGDEFAIVAPHTSLEAGRRLGERLLIQLRNHGDAAHAGISASVGVAVFDSRQHIHATPDALMRAADLALYSAKARGRNQVRVA